MPGLTANQCPGAPSPVRHSSALFCSGNVFLSCYCRGWMVILLKATGRVSSMDQNPALFLLQAKWEIILFFFFHIPESTQTSIVWVSSLFPFVPIQTSVWSSALHTNLVGAFFFAWLGVITVLYFIFISLLHLFAFDLLLSLIVSVCESEHVCTHENRENFCIYLSLDKNALSMELATGLLGYI